MAENNIRGGAGRVLAAGANLQAKIPMLNNVEQHLHKMFLAGAILAALSCFARADYNLPMFAFFYIMWDQDDVSRFKLFITDLQNDKVKLLSLLAVALLGDILWMFYWVPHWWSEAMAKWQSGLHTFVILCVFALVILKIIILPTLMS